MSYGEKRINNIIGFQFNTYIVKEFVGRIAIGNLGKKELHYKCICNCGKPAIITSSSIRGKIKKCICSHISRIKKNSKTKSPVYHIWANAKQRCFNKNSKDYHRYGGRGITMHHSWRNEFDTFKNDLGERPSLKHTLDRINNNGNYEPGNCRWATPKEQSANTRRNVFYEFYGVKGTQKFWAQYFNCSRYKIEYRIKKYGIEEGLKSIISTPYLYK